MANQAAQAVKQRIESLSAMHELAPRDFADESGLANQLARGFGKDELKATQLRKVFHALKDVERGVKQELRGRRKTPQDAFDTQAVSLMMPNLAYAYGRGLIPEEFYQILRLCLRDKVKTNEDFLRSVQFIEAVLAYHKFNYPSSSRG
jgi:CRISPR-associated protein Csm2